MVLYGLVKFAKWFGITLRARKGGWVVYEDGTGEVWVRRGEDWSAWWRRWRGRPREDEDLVVDGGNAERPRWIWRNIFKRRTGDAEERRALLE